MTITITGDVNNCGSRFGVFFSTCDVAPATWSDRCLRHTLIHEFLGGEDDGFKPNSQQLTLSGDTLYGMTRRGGGWNYGVVFSVRTDGTGFALLHEFNGGSSNEVYPNGSLTLSGDTLYGMTYQGCSSDYGMIFSIGTDGTGFTLLHEFAGGGSDGRYPHFEGPTVAGSVLYGMTAAGGDNDGGTIFKLQWE